MPATGTAGSDRRADHRHGPHRANHRRPGRHRGRDRRPHRAWRDGDTLNISGGDDFGTGEGFSFRSRRRSYRDWRDWPEMAEWRRITRAAGRAGQSALAVDAELSAGSLSVVGIQGPVAADLAAGSARPRSGDRAARRAHLGPAPSGSRAAGVGYVSHPLRCRVGLDPPRSGLECPGPGPCRAGSGQVSRPGEHPVGDLRRGRRRRRGPP